jgi:hypothetical protein
MIPGNSRISASSDTQARQRRIWLAALLLYGFAAAGDFSYHLVEHLRTGARVFGSAEAAVAFSAALFWPLDLTAMVVLGGSGT